MAHKIIRMTVYIGAILVAAGLLYLFDTLEEQDDRLSWLEAENERLVIMVPQMPGMRLDRAEP